MKNTKKFVPVMLMPFKNDKSIDYNALGQLVDLYLAAGAQGLFANCLSSEMYHLSKAEMLESVTFVVNRVAGRVPVVATGTFKESLEDQAAFVRAIYNTGVDSVIVISSIMADEEEEDTIFLRRVEELMALTPGVPLGFYECPLPYKRVLSASLLGQLVDSGRFNYHKDTSLDIAQVKDKLFAVADAESFGLYDAYMVHAVDSLKAGTAGLSCIQGNYFPDLVVWLCSAYADPQQHPQVERVQRFFSDHMDVMHTYYPMSAKYVLHAGGIPLTLVCRAADTPLTDAVRTELNNLVQAYQGLAQTLGLRSTLDFSIR